MPKTIDLAQRRDEIAQAVLTLVGERGVETATMRQIARAAGYTLGALPYYFRDKNELLLHALSYSLERSQARILDPAVPSEGLAGVAGLIEAALPLTPDSRTEWWLWESSWGRGAVSKRIEAENRRRYAWWEGVLLDRVRGAQSAGEFPATADPAAVTEHLKVITDGLGLAILRHPAVFTRERVRAHIEASLAALAGLPPG